MFNDHSESRLPPKCLQVEMKTVVSAPGPEGSASLPSLLSSRNQCAACTVIMFLLFFWFYFLCPCIIFPSYLSSRTGRYALSISVSGRAPGAQSSVPACPQGGMDDTEPTSRGEEGTQELPRVASRLTTPLDLSPIFAQDSVIPHVQDFRAGVTSQRGQWDSHLDLATGLCSNQGHST